MARVTQSGHGAYRAHVASRVGTSQEGEAMVLLSYVRRLAKQPACTGGCRTPKRRWGYQERGRCGDGIHHLYATVLGGRRLSPTSAINVVTTPSHWITDLNVRVDVDLTWLLRCPFSFHPPGDLPVWSGVVWCGVVCRRRCYQKAKGRDVYPRVQVNGLGCVCCVRAVRKCVGLGRGRGSRGDLVSSPLATALIPGAPAASLPFLLAGAGAAPATPTPSCCPGPGGPSAVWHAPWRGRTAYGVGVWCGVVWCGVVWCGVVCCGVVCCAVLCGAVLCVAVVCCAVVCHAVLRCTALVRCGVLYCTVVWRAMLCCAVPCCAVLCGAVLHCAVLCCALLCCAVLCCVVLCCDVLCCAGLGWAGLCCALLCCAVLCCAVLCCGQHHRRLLLAAAACCKKERCPPLTLKEGAKPCWLHQLGDTNPDLSHLVQIRWSLIPAPQSPSCSCQRHWLRAVRYRTQHTHQLR